MWGTRCAACKRFSWLGQSIRLQRAGCQSAALQPGTESKLWRPPGHGLSNAFSTGASVGDDEASGLRAEIVAAMDRLRTPETSQLHSYLEKCSTASHVELALGVLTRLRTLKAVQNNQRSNYRDHVAELFVQACLRAQVPKAALKALWKHNLAGFTPSLRIAHLLLADAKERKDVDFMLEVIRTMVANDVFPTTATADMVLRFLNDAGESDLLFKVAKEFHENGIVFRESVYDICISSAANSGQSKNVFEVDKWRAKHGILGTTASAFALVKAHLLRRHPDSAVRALEGQCPDEEKRSKYLSMLVRVWPQELAQKKRVKKASLLNLQDDTVALVNSLVGYGWSVRVDVPKEFGKGKTVASPH